MDFTQSPEEKARHEAVDALFEDPERRAAVAAWRPPNPSAVRELQEQLASAHYFDGANTDSGAVAQLAGQEALGAVSPGALLAVEMRRIADRIDARHGSGDGFGGRLGTGDTVALSPQRLEDREHLPVSDADATVLPDYELYGVLNAPAADWLVTPATLDGNTVVLLVNAAAVQVTAVPNDGGLGVDGLSVARVQLGGAPFADVAVVPPGEAAWRDVQLWLDEAVVAAALGTCQQCHQEAVAFAKSTRRGGKPLIARQEVGFRLADMHTQLHSARFLAYRAAWARASGDREAEVITRCARTFCAEAAESVASDAAQIIGTWGPDYGAATQRGVRAAKLYATVGTSIDAARGLIADDVLHRNPA